MYISEIDDILDQTLDKFMYLWIIENNLKELIDYNKLIKESNFIKYQKEINKILEFGFELISDKDINKFVNKKSNIDLIKNLILKYTGYYLFLLIGINYKGKIEVFNNNIIEFSRIQNNYKIKIDNFFNTESNSIIIKNTNLIKELIDYITKIINGKKIDNLLDNYSDSLKEFIKLYGNDNLNNLVKLFKKESNKKIILDHNIIKIIIYLNIYKNDEKKEIFNIIESTETSNGEFIFIDVVIPKSSFIDYNSIESVLEPYQLKTNLPEIIYDLINENFSENINDARKYFTDFDLKIQKLFDTHLIVPIIDDFLLYHKDNEKYHKIGEKVDLKKKDETKVKYIINKINTISDYYKNPSEIKKLFYVPLQDRNAVLINTYEDIKIISKMKNITKMNNENIDLLNDLIQYKLYPYISFKDFKNNGFFFSSDKTLNGIRNVSIEYTNKDKLNVLQTRIVSEDMLVNIVGFAIINNNDTIDCIDSNSFINICDETDNPIQVMKILLENKIKNLNFPNLKNTNILKNNYYWLFDLNKQKYSVPYYDISPNMNKNDVVKILSAYLYDWVIECIINIIKDDVVTSHPKLIVEYIDMFNKYKHRFNDINNSQYSNKINELEYLIYYIKSKKTLDLYDYKEDEFPGLYGNVFKLPIVPQKKTDSIPLITIKPDFKILAKPIEDNIIDNDEKNKDLELSTVDYETNEYINAICQHNISWDKIGELKKQNDAKYSNLVYEFIQQYVDISPTQDFVCKSCKSPINIKRFILDGQFDNNTQSFITFSVHIDIPLEELPEYEKFKTSIRSLDKIIERISSIINFSDLIGSNYSSRSKRKNIIKDTLDILINHNNYLKNSSYLSNRDKYVHQFGINKNISNLYIFELENNIFIYSSKEKDFYKFLKYNNIISYILILLILEINDTQIQALNNDKICSYYIYKKIGYTLFDNINIIVNKSHDIKPIQNFPILCYLIYIISCFITKYNIWADTLSTETNVIDKKKNFLIIQKSIINTIVEILNTILQVNMDELKSKKIYLYEILQNKYYFKIDLFKDFNIVKKLDKMYMSDYNIKQEKELLFDINKFNILPNNIIFNSFVYDDLYNKFSKKYCLQRLVCPFYDKNIDDITKISNLTNCISGEFHNFKNKNNYIVCLRCNEVANLNNFIPDSEKIIKERYNILYIRKLATKYCQSGLIHQFEYNDKLEQNKCINCSYIFGNMITFSDKELYLLYDKIQNKLKLNNFKIQKIINNLKNVTKNEILTITNLFNKIVYKYEKYNSNIIKSIDILLDSMQKLLGIDLIINNQSYNLYWNIYIIDHDYNGSKLDSPILVYEKENKFRVIKSHPYFKRDILVYTMQKNTKYELFYDLQEKILLGYREINKEYINLKKFNIKLKINYSLKNMLILFGFTRQQINIKDLYPEIYGMSGDKIDEKYKHHNMIDFINKIAYRRFNIIKNLGAQLKIYINRFKNNYKVNIITIEASYSNNLNQLVTNTYISDSANNPLDLMYVKYQKKIDHHIVTEIPDINVKKNNEKNNEKQENNKKNKKKQEYNKKQENNDNLTSSHIFLKYINLINMYLPFENLKLNKNDIPNFSDNIDYNIIFKNDYISNITLNYIIDEIIRLLNYNSNKNIKTNIIHFIADLICTLFNSSFFEISKFNQELNYFYQILYTSEFYLETQNSDYMIDAIDYYSNQEDIKNLDNLDEEQRENIINQIDDDNEEINAIDMDDEIADIEGMFDLYTKYDLSNSNDLDRNPEILI